MLVFDVKITVIEALKPLSARSFTNSGLTIDISEADLIYTETLMQRGKEIYEGKEIVILGGGDGALLYELLKENPKFVWMLEIDELVMRACNKYLKSICGDLHSNYGCKGPGMIPSATENKIGIETAFLLSPRKIIVEDCMLTVNQFIKEGKKVDFIFGDLTDIPISDSACGELWEFMITILQSAFKILKPTGKFMTHGNGATCPESLELYEQELMKLKPPVHFTKTKAFVPSFLEDWIFYQITFKTTDNGDA
ncbi:Spermine synthase [Eumeta japonica]|uniref:Spermine synthase n=1 Tax=Eumeta variegata TaxID=151549 RepID=A0A4C1W3C3_EUMVA|nr:Spermine synthase [Eumeta japonica]